MDPSTVDRSSPASSIHSNSSHSNHSLRIVIPDEPSNTQGSVSRKQMLLNQYRKEQNSKNDSSNEDEGGIHAMKYMRSILHHHPNLKILEHKRKNILIQQQHLNYVFKPKMDLMSNRIRLIKTTNFQARLMTTEIHHLH